MKRRLKKWDEEDAHESRCIYPYLKRPGVLRAIKRYTNKRERREGKSVVRTAIREIET